MPSAVLPDLKVTFPDGTGENFKVALTVAVNVTACPLLDGLGEEASETVVPLAFRIAIPVCHRKREQHVVKADADLAGAKCAVTIAEHYGQAAAINEDKIELAIAIKVRYPA